MFTALVRVHKVHLCTLKENDFVALSFSSDMIECIKISFLISVNLSTQSQPSEKKRIHLEILKKVFVLSVQSIVEKIRVV